MQIEGLNELNNSLNNASRNFNTEARKTINRIGNKLLRKVKLKTPVAEEHGGTLRRNWKYRPQGDLEGLVSNNTEYALHVEYGHRTRLGKGQSKLPKYKYKPKEGGIKFVEGRYMLTKSVEEMEKELEKEIEIMIDNLFK